MGDIQRDKLPRKRSPSYPAIDLEEAIRRVRQLWEKQHEYPTPLATAFGIWGYESTAGNANLVVAALRKFGLVDYEGTGRVRKVRVTPLAVQILSHPNPAMKKKAVQEAALLPPIHQELWAEFGAKLPTDDHLRWELEQERGFSRSGSSDFIPEYRRTIAYAGLLDGDTFADSEDQGQIEDGDDDDEPQTPLSPKRRKRRSVSLHEALTYAVPVAPGLDVAIEGPFPLSEAQWTQFMAVLQALKPGLVGENAEVEPEGLSEDS